jgi:hypothetical protein
MSDCASDVRAGTLEQIFESIWRHIMRARIAITIMGILAALAIAAAPASAATNVHQATLKGGPGFPAVTGSAKFSVDDGVRQLEAEIQHAKAIAGTKVRFRVS